MSHKLLELLTEVGLIIQTIKKQATTDQSLPKDPLNLVNEVLPHSNDAEEFQINLKNTLNEQNMNIDALIDYVSTLSEILSTPQDSRHEFGRNKRFTSPD